MIKVIGDQKKIVSEINITPLVDTLLVLLIIFMVTAPAMTRSVGIELPEPKNGSAAERIPQEKKNFAVIGINTKNQFIYEDIEYAPEEFFQKFPKLIEEVEIEKIFLHADKQVMYEQIIELMTFLQSQGHGKIGLVFQEK
ncbi:MAG: biopolymer transporter ExbD [SAR324 cluster bacterium]|jgi:biopolymer transport protein TolR|nr:biopolymer transporter ExbD [SAR324 cluster bacterium]MDG2066402.1 biopolymer transporter ExbD [SAR324 cluster bacterium]MDP6211103.1 biopolymer transporter ExbD [SAR324 cluster bacterium]|tara:strand:- start:388 stop:807 length:420 start_codon:yes stop_codon:yes gene_type:complete